MTGKEREVYKYLEKMGIEYIRHEHPPVYTVEEAKKYCADIAGAHCKNLFLRDRKGRRHFLVVAEQSRRVDLNDLSARFKAGGLSFASAERLNRFLGLAKGEVSPFGLINDVDNAVEILVDAGLRDNEKVNFHPNVNTATLTISYSHFEEFLQKSGYTIKYF